MKTLHYAQAGHAKARCGRTGVALYTTWQYVSCSACLRLLARDKFADTATAAILAKLGRKLVIR